MEISEVFRSKSGSTSTSSLQLKASQIIQGKITKIYPQGRALIQIGNNQVIADISAPLTAGERYLFRVEVEENPVHLKVRERMPRDSELPKIDTLLKKMGIPPNKNNQLFVPWR